MAKKKNLTKEVEVSETKENLDAVVVTDESVSKPAKQPKTKKEDKKADKKANKKVKDKNKEGFGKKIKRKSKETVSELKKVTWPGFGEVCKRTGVVLVVVLIFAVIIFGMDYGLGELMQLHKLT